MAEIIDLKETTRVENSVLAQMKAMDHEQILFCNDKKVGLQAIIAIHNTVCGPALGGTRMWTYASETEALTDVLRLSRGMTYKNSISGLNLGGGKAVIIGNAKTDKNEALFTRFGEFVDSLNGKYITAEDVGISPQDMIWVHQSTNHVVGLPDTSGDPSPVTAYGVYMGMKACAKAQFGNDSLANLKVAVQGVGHVGAYLIKHLAEEGAKIYISDIDEETLKNVANTYKAQVVGLDEIYDLPIDVYAPCALGATINDDTLGRLKCAIIAGSANNQLKDEVKHGKAVMDKGIIYAPDYMINAGGVINCFAEVDGLSAEWAMDKSAKIYDTTMAIIKKSKAENIPTYAVANKIAEERFKRG